MFVILKSDEKNVTMVGKEKLESCEDHQKECGVIKIFPSLKEYTCLFSVKGFNIFQDSILIFSMNV